MPILSDANYSYKNTCSMVCKCPRKLDMWNCVWNYACKCTTLSAKEKPENVSYTCKSSPKAVMCELPNGVKNCLLYTLETKPNGCAEVVRTAIAVRAERGKYVGWISPEIPDFCWERAHLRMHGGILKQILFSIVFKWSLLVFYDRIKCTVYWKYFEYI